MHVTLHANKVLAADEVQMRSIGWVLIQYDYVLVKRVNLDTEADVHRGKMI